MEFVKKWRILVDKTTDMGSDFYFEKTITTFEQVQGNFDTEGEAEKVLLEKLKSEELCNFGRYTIQSYYFEKYSS